MSSTRNVSLLLPDLYEFVIPEDLPTGKMGGKVKANDRDTGENSKSTYGIVEGDDQGVFEIITDTQTQEGILRLKKVSSSRNSSALLATLGVNYRPNRWWRRQKTAYCKRYHCESYN